MKKRRAYRQFAAPRDRTKPPKPYKPRTEAQERATRILRIRGLWYHTWILTGWRRRAMQWLVDMELEAHGVESQTLRHCRQRAELMAELEKDPQND